MPGLNLLSEALNPFNWKKAITASPNVAWNVTRDVLSNVDNTTADAFRLFTPQPVRDALGAVGQSALTGLERQHQAGLGYWTNQSIGNINPVGLLNPTALSAAYKGLTGQQTYSGENLPLIRQLPEGSRTRAIAGTIGAEFTDPLNIATGLAGGAVTSAARKIPVAGRVVGALAEPIIGSSNPARRVAGEVAASGLAVGTPQVAEKLGAPKEVQIASGFIAPVVLGGVLQPRARQAIGNFNQNVVRAIDESPTARRALEAYQNMPIGFSLKDVSGENAARSQAYANLAKEAFLQGNTERARGFQDLARANMDAYRFRVQRIGKAISGEVKEKLTGSFESAGIATRSANASFVGNAHDIIDNALDFPVPELNRMLDTIERDGYQINPQTGVSNYDEFIEAVRSLDTETQIHTMWQSLFEDSKAGGEGQRYLDNTIGDMGWAESIARQNSHLPEDAKADWEWRQPSDSFRQIKDDLQTDLDNISKNLTVEEETQVLFEELLSAHQDMDEYYQKVTEFSGGETLSRGRITSQEGQHLAQQVLGTQQKIAYIERRLDELGIKSRPIHGGAAFNPQELAELLTDANRLGVPLTEKMRAFIVQLTEELTEGKKTGEFTEPNPTMYTNLRKRVEAARAAESGRLSEMPSREFNQIIGGDRARFAQRVARSNAEETQIEGLAGVAPEPFVEPSIIPGGPGAQRGVKGGATPNYLIDPLEPGQVTIPDLTPAEAEAIWRSTLQITVDPTEIIDPLEHRRFAAFQRLLDGKLSREGVRNASPWSGSWVDKGQRGSWSVLDAESATLAGQGITDARRGVLNEQLNSLVNIEPMLDDNGLVKAARSTDRVRRAAGGNALPPGPPNPPRTGRSGNRGRYEPPQPEIPAERPRLHFISETNAILKTMWASLDGSWHFLQGLLLAYHNPNDYVRAMRDSAYVMVHPESYLEMMTKISNRARAAGLPPVSYLQEKGLQLQYLDGHGVEFGIPVKFDEFGRPAAKADSLVDSITRTIANFPPIKRASIWFAVQGDMARVNAAYDLMRRGYDFEGNHITVGSLIPYRTTMGTPAPSSWDELVPKVTAAVNRATGTSAKYSLDSIRDFLFAPRFLASQFESIWKALTDGSIEGAYARTLFLKMMAYGTAVTFIANEALNGNEDTVYLDPTDPNFMRIRDVGGADISVFGPWDSMLKAFVAISSGDAEYAIRTKLSPVLSLGVDILSGRNLFGEPVPNPMGGGSETFSFVKQNLFPFAWREVGEEPAIVTGLNFFGVKASPLSAREQLEKKMRNNGADPDDPLARRLYLASHPEDKPRYQGEDSDIINFINEDVDQRRALNDDRFQLGQINVGEWREARRILSKEMRDRLSLFENQFNKQPRNLQEEWVQTYYDIFKQEGVTDTVDNTLNGEAYDLALTEWLAKYGDQALTYIYEFSDAGSSEIERQYLGAMRQLRALGYFDMPRFIGMISGRKDEEIQDLRNRVSARRGVDAQLARMSFDDAAFIFLQQQGFGRREIIDVINAGKEAYKNPEIEAFKAQYPGLVIWFNENARYEEVQIASGQGGAQQPTFGSAQPFNLSAAVSQ